MTTSETWVFVVDDDASMRRSLSRLFRSSGHQTAMFSSAVEFLEYQRPDAPGCLVLDVQLPDLDGLGLQDSLSENHVSLPIVFITGYGNIPMSVRAIKGGAFDFLTKPFAPKDLLRSVEAALANDVQDRERRSDIDLIQQRFETLSPREREVFAHVVDGSLNKQIGRHLGVTEKTIKVHRGQVMRKMKAGSLAELVRMADKLGFPGARDRLPTQWVDDLSCSLLSD